MRLTITPKPAKQNPYHFLPNFNDAPSPINLYPGGHTKIDKAQGPAVFVQNNLNYAEPRPPSSTRR
jgi:hypothetical protein